MTHSILTQKSIYLEAEISARKTKEIKNVRSRVLSESFPKSQNRIYPLLKMSAAQMEKHLFNLKFASKQLLRDSKKCEKEEKAERAKLKKAMEKGNMEVARIHAENGKFSLPIRQFFVDYKIYFYL